MRVVIKETHRTHFVNGSWLSELERVLELYVGDDGKATEFDVMAAMAAMTETRHKTK